MIVVDLTTEELANFGVLTKPPGRYQPHRGMPLMNVTKEMPATLEAKVRALDGRQRRRPRAALRLCLEERPGRPSSVPASAIDQTRCDALSSDLPNASGSAGPAA